MNFNMKISKKHDPDLALISTEMITATDYLNHRLLKKIKEYENMIPSKSK